MIVTAEVYYNMSLEKDSLLLVSDWLFGDSKNNNTNNTKSKNCILEMLSSLKTVWMLWEEDDFEEEKRIQIVRPKLDDMKDLVAQIKGAQDAKWQRKMITAKKEEAISICCNMLENINSFIDQNLNKMSLTQIVLSLDVSIQRLTETMNQRKQEIDDLLLKRNRLIRELQEQLPPITKNSNNTYSYNERVYGVSQTFISLLETEITDLCETRYQRQKTIKQLANELVSYLVTTDDAQRSDNSKVDKLAFNLVKKEACQGISAVSPSTNVMNVLIERKEQLLSEEEHKKTFMEDVKKKMRLIEDRQALLGLVKDVEASAESPLRLFGDSKRLLREAKFRKQAYPRLLAIERVLYPTLVNWNESHKKVFSYHGIDYLAAMTEDLKTRRIPRGLFSPPDDLNTHTSDFEYVVSEACCDADICDDEDKDSAWCRGNIFTRDAETDEDRQRRKLLRLGWRPPSGGGGDLVPPQKILKKKSCTKQHVNSSICFQSHSVFPDYLGSDVLPKAEPRIFKFDPHLLLPLPPSAKIHHANIRRKQIIALEQAKHVPECRHDHAAKLREERQPKPARYSSGRRLL